MKLPDAYARLLTSAARGKPEIDRMSLADVEREVNRLTRILRAWQLVAHSKRTSDRWEAAAYRMKKDADVSPEALALLPDQDLKDLTAVGNPAHVRRAINAEVLRRAQKADKL